MIFQDLAKTTQDMQSLQKRVAIHKNKSAQDATDIKYRLLLTQVNKCVETIEFLDSELSLSTDSSTIANMENILSNLEECVSSGLAESDSVNKAENSFKTLQTDMKKTWSKQYTDITGSTVSTLEAIRGISEEKVNACLEKIQEAGTWDLNLLQYQKMQEGLQEANSLIESMGLDDDIRSFLQRTTDGKATLFDLTDKVLQWIREEKLENKIRISFVRNFVKK